HLRAGPRALRRPARLLADGDARGGDPARRRDHGAGGRPWPGQAGLLRGPPPRPGRPPRRHPDPGGPGPNPDDHEGRPAPQGAGRGAAESSVARRARPRVARATGPRRRSADGQAGLLRPRRLVRTEVVDVAIAGPRMVRPDQVMAGRPVADPAAT